MSSITKIDICTSALLLVGADEITSFEDSTREAKLCASIYQTTFDALLQTHPWRFSIGQVLLNRLDATPLFGYSYAFQLPSNYLRLIGKNNTALKHDIFEDKLYCDASSVSLNYQFTPSETRLPAYFVRALEFELAQILSIALVEDDNKHELFRRSAREQLIRGKSTDSQSNGNHTMPAGNFALTAIRH